MTAVTVDEPPPGFPGRRLTVSTPIFGLSTTPVMDIKAEVRQQIERDLLALLYRTPR
jgi:hypothetical protein